MTAFVFMELCNGGDLGDDIERSPVPYPRNLAKRYFYELKTRPFTPPTLSATDGCLLR